MCFYERNRIGSLNKRQRLTRLIRTTVPSGNTSRKVYARKNRDGGGLDEKEAHRENTRRPSGFMNAFVL